MLLTGAGEELERVDFRGMSKFFEREIGEKFRYKQVMLRMILTVSLESGMQKDARWAVKGERRDIERIVLEVVRNQAVQ